MPISPDQAKRLYESGQIREDQFLAMVGDEPTAEPTPVDTPLPNPEPTAQPEPQPTAAPIEEPQPQADPMPAPTPIPEEAGIEALEEMEEESEEIPDGVDVSNRIQQQPITQAAQRTVSALDRLDASYVEEQAAIQEAATAGKAQAAAESAYQQEAFEQAEKERVALEARIAAQNKEIEAQKGLYEKEMQELKETSIDPSRYWKNQSGFQKVMMAIGIGLSAADGNAQTRTMKIIDQAIARDIEAQKAELNKRAKIVDQRGSMISRLSQTFNDEVLREKAAHGMLLQNAKLQIDSIRSRYESQKIQANADLLTAQVEQKRLKVEAEFEERARQLAIKNAVIGGGEVSPELLDEKDRERFVPGMKGLAVTKEGATEVRQLKASVDTANNGLDRLLEISQQAEYEKLSPSLRAEVGTIQQTLIGILRLPLTGPGVLTDSEKADLKTLIANPTKLLSLDSSSRTKLNTLKERLQINLNFTARANGLTPQPTRKEQAQEMGEIKRQRRDK